MTITTRNGRNLKLAFIHSSPFFEGAPDTRANAGVVRKALDFDAGVVGRRLTLCDITEVVAPDVYNVLAQGVAICHETDTFNKSVGRKVSLTYALQGASDPEAYPDGGVALLTREDREDVWAAYLAEFGTTKR